MARYLTMVGQLQWLMILGSFDLHAQVAAMSKLRDAPRQGHMDRLKRIYSYAIRTKDHQLGSELINLITLSYQIEILTGHTLYMVMSMKSFLMTCLTHLARP